ncbi:MAG TPA: malto-oligosyltrehalose synthase [Gaiellaceae bacterium]|nr:malto-oligosyltrehalose synthase [Gaiellaceae bacterium]
MHEPSAPDETSRLHCTYRLQLLPHLDFAGARRLVPYLRRLGVSHLYVAPSMQARHGSTHGYDVVDPTRVSEELGGEEELRKLAEAGLGLILDFVPNHMAASDSENPFWEDPLTRAKFFDVEWRTGWVRRFFDIGDLAGVRQEDPEVFEATHAKLIELVRDGVVDGVRIDHVDGLANPARYLERLREAGIERVWVEKILEHGEPLRDWTVEGTTGYEFANDVTALFVDEAARAPLTELYGDFTGETRAFAEIAGAAKLDQARTTFRPEVEWLRNSLGDVEPDCDLAEALASHRVYRTYADPDAGLVDGLDRSAVAEARLPRLLADILLLEERGHDAFVIRFQQTTPPVLAKGVEDTAFYRYSRLLCLNEVGGDPDRFSLAVDAFHAAVAERLRRHPHQLLTTQTHDTKRSGDVRARISALSWFPDEWASCVADWSALADRHRRGRGPDREEEYLIYQTIVGAWPIDANRLGEYLVKAMREGKVNSNWIEPDTSWEEDVLAFARAILADDRLLASFVPFAERVAAAGDRISLAQTLLKLTSPGVPDIYQGDELLSLNLVDPDNRRPVDWARRAQLLEHPTRESAKQTLIVRALELRRRHADAFATEYAPLDAGDAVCAFHRGDDVVAAVPLRADAEFDPPEGFADVLPEGLGARLLVRRGS